MVDAGSLFQKILEDPDDDDLRLRYADAVEASDPDHASLIRTQVQLWNHYSPELKMEEQRVLARCARRLVAPIQSVVRYATLRRGFIFSVHLAAPEFLEHGNQIRGAGPIERIRFDRVDVVATRLLQSPLLAGVRGLDLRRNQLDDEHIRTLASSPHLASLRHLDLSFNRISRRGLGHLMQSDGLPDLQWLGFEGNIAESPTPMRLEGDGGRTYAQTDPPIQAELIEEFGDRPWLHRTAEPRYW